MICVYVICGYMHKCIYEYMNMSMYPCMDMYEERYSKTFYELWLSVKTYLYHWNNTAITRWVRPRSIDNGNMDWLSSSEITQLLLLDVCWWMYFWSSCHSSLIHQISINCSLLFYFLTWSFMFVAFFIIFYFYYFLYNHSIFCLIK
jgi:hypothetical protein